MERERNGKRKKWKEKEIEKKRRTSESEAFARHLTAKSRIFLCLNLLSNNSRALFEI